jgi:C-terminal processing protease CtpA/Prc
LEYSAWTPNYLEPQSRYHRDLTAENIPYVVICDLYSISMGEAEAEVIKALLPTSYIVGERTFGATGALQSESYIDLSYGGPFGDYDNGPHYIYTATFECATNGKVLEGIGITPDLEVLRKNYNGDFKPQLDAAINYIQSRH